MMNSNKMKIVKERWKILNIRNLRAICPAFENESFPQAHASLEALKEGVLKFKYRKMNR